MEGGGGVKKSGPTVQPETNSVQTSAERRKTTLNGRSFGVWKRLSPYAAQRMGMNNASCTRYKPKPRLNLPSLGTKSSGQTAALVDARTKTCGNMGQRQLHVSFAVAGATQDTEIVIARAAIKIRCAAWLQLHGRDRDRRCRRDWL
jgi:hypothetical protein